MMKNCAALWLLVMWLSPVLLACQGKTTACKSNLKNLATALEMYATDHQGHYPDSLQTLVNQKYLKTIPSCPEARCDTYSCSYQRLQGPDQFVLCCTGAYHRKVLQPNHPAYSAEQGLVADPPEEQTAEPCVRQLAKVGRAMERFQASHGRYPKKLEELSPHFLSKLPVCPAGPLMMGHRQGRLQISCPGHAHLVQGYQAFQPAWVAGQGVSQLRLPSPQPRPDSRRATTLLGLSLVSSLLLLALNLRS